MATVLLVEARFYPHLNAMLLAGARAAVEAAGHKHETLTVPGALEIPGAIALAGRAASRSHTSGDHERSRTRRARVRRRTRRTAHRLARGRDAERACWASLHCGGCGVIGPRCAAFRVG